MVVILFIIINLYFAIIRTLVKIYAYSVINDGIEGIFIIPSSFNFNADFDSTISLTLPVETNLM